MILETKHSHFYPGMTGNIHGTFPAKSGECAVDCLVVFSDGATTSGRMRKGETGWLLSTLPYRTAARTHIPAKGWLLQFDDDNPASGFRVVAKLNPERMVP